MKTVIIAKGEMKKSDVLIHECKDADYIICADGGADYAYKSNILPDLIIGDLDSIDSDVLKYFTEKGVGFEKYPREKDYTDTEICLYKAFEKESDIICIAQGVGGRIDHSLGNIFLLSMIEERNAKGYIASDTSYIYLCKDEIAIEGKKGDIVSIIPFRGNACGLVTQGLKYILNNGDIDFGRAIGISNEMEEEKCSIKISSGKILIVKLSS